MSRAVLAIFLGILAGCVATNQDKTLDWKQMRFEMVDSQIRVRGIKDQGLLRALENVPRHEFVPPDQQHLAYEDHPLPIGLNQTISQPYIVALMTELAQVKPGDKILEIGTGSGYQAAVLAELGAEVYSIEILEELAKRADRILMRLGYKVQVRAGDGWNGWPEEAPFSAILITASAPKPPPELVKQLAVGGRLVLPEEDPSDRLRQTLWTYEKKPNKELVRGAGVPVRFVPMTGQAGESR